MTQNPLDVSPKTHWSCPWQPGICSQEMLTEETRFAATRQRVAEAGTEAELWVPSSPQAGEEEGKQPIDVTLNSGKPGKFPEERCKDKPRNH